MEGEIHDGSACKCGNRQTCYGEVTGAICDVDNSVCKCAQNVDACTSGEVCQYGQCGM